MNLSASQYMAFCSTSEFTESDAGHLGLEVVFYPVNCSTPGPMISPQSDTPWPFWAPLGEGICSLKTLYYVGLLLYCTEIIPRPCILYYTWHEIFFLIFTDISLSGFSYSFIRDILFSYFLFIYSLWFIVEREKGRVSGTKRKRKRKAGRTKQKFQWE